MNLSNPPRGPFSLSSPGLHAVHQFLVLFVVVGGVGGEGGGDVGLFFFPAYVVRRIEFDRLSATRNDVECKVKKITISNLLYTTHWIFSP